MPASGKRSHRTNDDSTGNTGKGTSSDAPEDASADTSAADVAVTTDATSVDTSASDITTPTSASTAEAELIADVTTDANRADRGLTDSDLGTLADANAAAADTSDTPDALRAATPPPTVDAGHHGRTSTVRLPFITASFTRTSGGPSVPTPSLPNPLDALADAGQAVTAAVATVPRQKAVFYLGVGALGVLGVVDWPVAAVVAAGTYVASRAHGRSTNASNPDASPNFPHA
jgi:hypothetical protein